MLQLGRGLCLLVAGGTLVLCPLHAEDRGPVEPATVRAR